MSEKTSQPRKSEPAERPLEGWKEIAGYLQRSVRTAKRWEQKDGLPVQRQVHDSRTSVYAYPGELDAWRTDRKPAADVATVASSPWWRPVTVLVSTVAVALALLAAGSEPEVGASGGEAGTSDGRLTIRRGPDLDMYSKPSPDGKYMAHVDWDTGNLAVLDVASGDTRLLTDDGSWGEKDEFAESSAWSRDSTRIAFAWSVNKLKETRGELRLASLNGDSPPRTIAIPGARWSWPIEWSPDDSHLLCGFQIDRGRSHLALVSATGDEIEKLNLELGPGRWLWPQFAGDGRTILYSYPSDGKGAPHDIYLRNLDTGENMSVIEHPAEDLLVGAVPGTDWLLFASNRRGRLDLWGVPFREQRASGPPVLVSQGIGRFFPLGFTDDGRYYYATLSATDDVLLVDFDPAAGKVSGEPRKLASRREGANMHPCFSPDGESLAYVTKRSPMPIPTHSADSLVVQPLGEGPADPLEVGFDDLRLTGIAGPCWSGDGRSIVLGGGRGKVTELYRVDLPSLRKAKIYSAPEGQRLRYHDCAGGKQGFYLLLEGEGSPPRVLWIDPKGRNPREVYRTPQGQRIDTFAISPDGKELSVITRLDRYRRALVVMPIKGGSPSQIHEFRQLSGGSASHAWTPDGNSIIFVSRWPEEKEWMWSIRKVPVTGGTAETVLEWKGPYYGPRFHPDGRLLAFTGRSGASSDSVVWVIENLKDELELTPSSRNTQ